MASSQIEKRKTSDGTRYRVRYRLGGREAKRKYAGSFETMREAKIRRAWIDHELAARRVPDLAAFEEPQAAPLLRDVAKRWQESRVDVRASTLVQHRVALGRVLPVLGDHRIDSITAADVAELVAKLAGEGKARETIRKSVTALAMVLDHAEITPNPARNRVQVRLPLEEPDEMEPPTAGAVEAVAHLLAPGYLVALLALDATGCRVGELAAATVGDLDEDRRRWKVRKSVAKTRRERWVVLPAELFDVLLDRLPAREDRDLSAPLFGNATADRLRTAIARACRDAGVPAFSPHDLRHRRISLLHWQGEDWATIGKRVGQRNLLVTSETYTHVLPDDGREIDRPKLLARVTRAGTVAPSVTPSNGENPVLAGPF